MKIKLSKSQWEQIGKTAGWIKLASEQVFILHSIAQSIGGTVSKTFSDYTGKMECMAINCDDPAKCIELAAVNGILGAKIGEWNNKLGSKVFWPKIPYEAYDASSHSGYLNSIKGKQDGIYIVDETGILESFSVGQEREAERSFKQFDMNEQAGIGISLVRGGIAEWIKEPRVYNTLGTEE